MTFPVVRVSQNSHNLVLDLEQAYDRLAAAPAGDKAVLDAYAVLCQRKKDLYEYISELEAKARILPEVTLRFD